MPSEFDSFFHGNGSQTDQPSAASDKKETRVVPLPANRYGITDERLLEMCEDVAGTVRVAQQFGNYYDVPGKYDAAHLREIHVFVMGDIHTRPGGTREDEWREGIAKAKDTPGQERPLISDGRRGAERQIVSILPANHVNKRLNELGQYLEKTQVLGGLEMPAFVNRLAEVYLEYAYASPFAGGNQAVLNVVLQKIGRDAGYDVKPTLAPDLPRVTDAALVAGREKADARRALIDVLGAVTTPGVSREAALRRNILRRQLEPIVSEEVQSRRRREDMGQAGIDLAGRVGGQQGIAYRASMRAILSGSIEAEHINTVRTTVRQHASPAEGEMVRRIEKNGAWLDNYRRSDQQQARTTAVGRPSLTPERSQTTEIGA